MGRTTSDRDFDAPPQGSASHAGESWARLGLFLALLAVFSLLTFLAVSSGSPSDVRQRPRILTTLATVTGPFTGAIARDGQSCCLGFSLWLAAWLAPPLVLAVLAQLVLKNPGRRGRFIRLALWTGGWTLWLAGGLVSFLHAFE